MNMGTWEVNVDVNGMPQKVATAFDKMQETLVGAEYEMIAYLGSQTVNGVNHAVLAEQVITTGRDTKNIVVLIFNEKPKEMEATLVGIERIVESGMELGGTKINVEKILDLEGTAMTIWNEAFEEFVGASVRPFAYLGSRIFKGTDYIYAATINPVALSDDEKAVVVTVNPLTRQIHAVDMLENRQNASFKYAFSW